MAFSVNTPSLPADLEAIFSVHKDNPEELMKSFMPALCDHIKADRIFLQPRNPHTRVCKVMIWRRTDDIPLPKVPGANTTEGEWFVEDKWEIEDPLWRAAMQLKPSIYISDLEEAAKSGLLNLEFENSYMFHTAFIHGHAHWPSFPLADSEPAASSVEGERQFYGSVQPAVFDGPRIWTNEIHDLVDRCLVRIAPVMKVYGESAPPLDSFEDNRN